VRRYGIFKAIKKARIAGIKKTLREKIKNLANKEACKTSFFSYIKLALQLLQTGFQLTE
jgi:hypothetical protein